MITFLSFLSILLFIGSQFMIKGIFVCAPCQSPFNLMYYDSMWNRVEVDHHKTEIHVFNLWSVRNVTHTDVRKYFIIAPYNHTPS